MRQTNWIYEGKGKTKNERLNETNEKMKPWLIETSTKKVLTNLSENTS